MCSESGLEVKETDTNESDSLKAVVSLLDRLARLGKICEPVTDDLKLPFIDFFAQ